MLPAGQLHRQHLLTGSIPHARTCASPSSQEACRLCSQLSTVQTAATVCRASNGSTAVAEPHQKAAPRSPYLTGGMDSTTSGATNPFADKHLQQTKHIVIVRHGQSTWNLEKRIQGDDTQSTLTELGREQAAQVREALQDMHFDSCYSSPIPRARQFADIVWEGRPGEPANMQALKEAHLGFLQGMLNSEAAEHHAEAFQNWRQSPDTFEIDGFKPVEVVFDEARDVWRDILAAEGSTHLLITHKSILRALLCVALGLGPPSFRAIDAHNGSVSVFRVNTRGEPMMTNLNLTSHLNTPGVRY